MKRPPECEVCQFGQRVYINAFLRRTQSHRSLGDTNISCYWKTIPLKKIQDGIVIGKRSLNNGTVDYQEGYSRDFTFNVYLVATNMRSNPVYVLPENLSLKRPNE